MEDDRTIAPITVAVADTGPVVRIAPNPGIVAVTVAVNWTIAGPVGFTI